MIEFLQLNRVWYSDMRKGRVRSVNLNTLVRKSAKKEVSQNLAWDSETRESQEKSLRPNTLARRSAKK